MLGCLGLLCVKVCRAAGSILLPQGSPLGCLRAKLSPAEETQCLPVLAGRSLRDNGAFGGTVPLLPKLSPLSLQAVHGGAPTAPLHLLPFIYNLMWFLVIF